MLPLKMMAVKQKVHLTGAPSGKFNRATPKRFILFIQSRQRYIQKRKVSSGFRQEFIPSHYNLFTIFPFYPPLVWRTNLLPSDPVVFRRGVFNWGERQKLFTYLWTSRTSQRPH